MKTIRCLTVLAAAALVLPASNSPFRFAVGDHMLISRSSDGQTANWNFSVIDSLSGDGRYAAFSSDTDNLVTGDTNGAVDIFIHDRQLRTTWRVSVSSDGSESNKNSGGACLSRDGRYVAFFSEADGLVANDTNGKPDVFIHDNQTGETRRVSVSGSGEQANGASYTASFSADGRYLAFSSDASNLVVNDSNGLSDVFIKDLQTGAIILASVNSAGQAANGVSDSPAISGDGKHVAFSSTATDLVADDTNDVSDVFVRDLDTGTTGCVSRSTAGEQGNRPSNEQPSLSDNGLYVVFTSGATNLDGIDPDGEPDVFLRDRVTGQTKMISKTPEWGDYLEISARGRISANGRMIVFGTFGTTLVYDRLAGTIEAISPAWGEAHPYYGTAISADGYILGYAGIFGEPWILCYTYEYGPPNEMRSFSFNRSVVAGQNYFAGKVELFAPLNTSSVDLQLSTSSAQLVVPAKVRISRGQQNRVFMVRSLPVDSPTTESVTIRWNSQSLTATVVLTPLVPSAFQFTPNPVVGGGQISARMVMNGVAGTGGQLVLLSDNSPYATTPVSVVVPPQASQAIFTIQTLPVTTTQYVTLTASTPQGSKTAHFVIRPRPTARGGRARAGNF